MGNAPKRRSKRRPTHVRPATVNDPPQTASKPAEAPTRATTAPAGKPPQITPEPVEAPKSKSDPAPRAWGAWKAWKEVWAFVGPCIALTSFYFLMQPNVTIDPSVNLDPGQPLATQFQVTNRGHFTVSDVLFTCKLGGANLHIGKLPLLLGPVPLTVAELAPGEAVTVACAELSHDVEFGDLQVIARYKWPLSWWQSTIRAHFSLRKGTPGFFLVPGR
jgi:hypothetical protein